MVNLAPAILNGWKEIANFLGKGVRTVQRYEREMGLPIHRPSGTSGGAVIGIQSELSSWVSSGRKRGDSMPRRRALNGRTNKLRADFLTIDSEVGLTFSNLALTATSPEKKRRTAQTARKAYDTIMRLREDADLSDAEESRLEANLRRLKSELESLGQEF